MSDRASPICSGTKGDAEKKWPTEQMERNEEKLADSSGL